MGKGEENPQLSMPSSSNPTAADILTTAPNMPNYTHNYYPPRPAWSPTFMPYPDAYQYTSNMNAGYPFQYGMGPSTPLMLTSSETEVSIGKEDTPGSRETETPSSSSRVHEQGEEDRPDLHETEYGTVGSLPFDQMDSGDMIMEPKSGMEFDSFEELLEYYKLYTKKCEFGSMTQRSERDDEGSVRYVTIGCTHGGKARNRTMNVAKPRPTGKTDCKAQINALKVREKMQLTTVHNTHNHGLSPQKSRFFRCNREVSEAAKRVLDTNDLVGIRMNKSFGSLVVGAGGFQNLPFLEKDCRNYIDKARYLRLGARKKI